MSRKFNEDVAGAMQEIVHTYLGAFILESIEDMLAFSDMSEIQKLAVIDGAIALGAWQSTQDELEQLRDLRASFVEGLE